MRQEMDYFSHTRHIDQLVEKEHPEFSRVCMVPPGRGMEQRCCVSWDSIWVGKCRPVHTAIRPSVRSWLGVRFRKALPILQLTAIRSVFPLPQARHTLGLGYPAPLHQENPLFFFSLLAIIPVEHPTHNRWVCLYNRVEEFIYNRIIELWKTHRPTMAGAWVRTHWPESVGVMPPAYSKLGCYATPPQAQWSSHACQ
jgi:hypothetical protein